MELRFGKIKILQDGVITLSLLLYHCRSSYQHLISDSKGIMSPAMQGSDFHFFLSLDRNNLFSTLALNQFQSPLERLGISRRKN